MASYALESLRRWASAAEPEYNRLPTNDNGEHEPKGTSSSHGLGLDILLLLPTLAIRFVYLCWLMATRPFRRSSSASSWPATFEQLGRFQVLVPSFWHPVDPSRPVKKMHPTAWLDGLRGVAAFMVVLQHSTMLGFKFHIYNGYASREGETWICQLPIIRLFSAGGEPAVALFYVISGYALSYKPVRLARSRRFGEAYESIGSAAFRRWPRLFFMPIVVTLFTALATYLDLIPVSGWNGGYISSRRPKQFPTFLGQMEHWLPAVVKMADPFAKNLLRGKLFNYDFHLWTLPMELDCSLMLFLCQAAFTRLRPNARLAIMFGLAVFTMRYGHWQNYLFLVGMIVCELNFTFDGPGGKPTTAAPTLTISSTASPAVITDNGIVSEKSSTGSLAQWRRFYQRNRTRIGIFFFVLNLYVMSLPATKLGGATTPGYRTIYSLIPKYHIENKMPDAFWVPLTATFAVFIVDRTPALQILFTNPVSQYIGKISFSMYVVHGPILFSFGHWYVRQTTAITGRETNMQHGIGIAMAFALFLPTLIFVADLVTRTLDQWALNLARRMYEALTYKDEAPAPERAVPDQVQ